MTPATWLPLRETVEGIRGGRISPVELVSEALDRHELEGRRLRAYRRVNGPGALKEARRVERAVEKGEELPPFSGIPISVKDLYGVDGFLTFAGSPRSLPSCWTRDGWLVNRFRSQGAVVMGKTHTVEFAYGALGVNPHWGTPRNPWDAQVHRIPGGSSSGAGVSLWEGSAMVALGTDTGGSIRIPASMTGGVGLRTTTGRWPTDGVVPLSSSLDVVGALTRSVEDAAYVFGAVDPRWGDPVAFLEELGRPGASRFRLGRPSAEVWEACESGVRNVLEQALEELVAAGWGLTSLEGDLIRRGEVVYLDMGLAGAECRAFLQEELDEWIPLLHPVVGDRIRRAPELGSAEYREALAERERIRGEAGELFRDVSVWVLPSTTFSPPPLEEVAEGQAYGTVNRAALRPTCSASVMDLPAITLPVGLDPHGMPVGLQLLGPRGSDEELLRVALMAERILGRSDRRLGVPSLLGESG